MGAFEDDDYLPMSGLQHLLYCERQCALIHVERLWRENVPTAEGRVVHERAHDPAASEGGRVVRGLRLRSDRLQLSGQADVVEFLPDPGKSGKSVPFPVEYKRGRAKYLKADQVQLCAQAMALEDMMSINVPAGALYYRSSRKRIGVEFNEELRRLTSNAAARFHEIVRRRELPPGIYETKCRQCSLIEVCQPRDLTCPPASTYLSSVFAALGKDENQR